MGGEAPIDIRFRNEPTRFYARGLPFSFARNAVGARTSFPGLTLFKKTIGRGKCRDLRRGNTFLSTGDSSEAFGFILTAGDSCISTER